LSASKYYDVKHVLRATLQRKPIQQPAATTSIGCALPSARPSLEEQVLTTEHITSSSPAIHSERNPSIPSELDTHESKDVWESSSSVRNSFESDDGTDLTHLSVDDNILTPTLDKGVFACWMHTTKAWLEKVFQHRTFKPLKKSQNKYVSKSTGKQQAPQTIRRHQAENKKREAQHGLCPLDKWLKVAHTPQKINLGTEIISMTADNSTGVATAWENTEKKPRS
jgi:hypothetical protein